MNEITYLEIFLHHPAILAVLWLKPVLTIALGLIGIGAGGMVAHMKDWKISKKWSVTLLSIFIVFSMGEIFYISWKYHQQEEVLAGKEREIMELKKELIPSFLRLKTMNIGKMEKNIFGFNVYLKLEKEDFKKPFKFFPLIFEARIPREFNRKILNFSPYGGFTNSLNNRAKTYWRFEVNKPIFDLYLSVSGPTKVIISSDHLENPLVLDIR